MCDSTSTMVALSRPRALQLLAAAALLLCPAACEDKPSTAPAAGAKASNAAAGRGKTMSKGGAITVNTSTPKIKEAEFMKALDGQLDQVFADVKGKTFRSRAHMSSEMGKRLAPKQMINATAKAMGVRDVSVLSLFASDPGIGKRVSAHIKERTKTVVDQLIARSQDLPMVVEQDCREAATKGIALKQVAAGKRKPTPDDRRDAPLAAQLLIECKKASETQPELKCYIDAADEAALAKCSQ